MSNKFLSTSSSTGSVSDGTTTIFGSSIGASNLRPSYPVKTNSLRQIVSEKLDVSDINNLQIQLDGVVKVPYSGTFIATDYESQTQGSINETLQKIDNFGASGEGNTNLRGTLNVTAIKTFEIFDTDTISGIQLSSSGVKIISSDLNLNTNNITQVNDITSNRFIVAGGTAIQYLLADGSTITQSANSGNSNFYLYHNNSNGGRAPPIAAGDIEYNTITQAAATFVYISHLTRDNIDVEIFFQNVSTLNILYIQDQDNSANFIRYDITGNATIVTNEYISVPVSMLDYGGNGNTTFGVNKDILISIFTNTQETNTRLSAVETKTQNQSAVSNTTNFNGRISIDNSMEIWRAFGTLQISNIAAQNGSSDNVLCLEHSESLITSDNTIKPKIQYLSTTTGNTIIGSNFIPLTNNTYDLGSTTNRFNNAYANTLYNGSNYNVLKRGPLYIMTTPITITNPTSGYPGLYQNMMPSTNGILNLNNILANTLEIGSSFVVNLSGSVVIPVAGDRTGIGLFTGTTSLGNQGGAALTAATYTFQGNATFTIRTLGSSGTLACNGRLLFRTGANGTFFQQFVVPSVAINTTIDNLFTVRLLCESNGAIGSTSQTISSLTMERIY